MIEVWDEYVDKPEAEILHEIYSEIDHRINDKTLDTDDWKNAIDTLSENMNLDFQDSWHFADILDLRSYCRAANRKIPIDIFYNYVINKSNFHSCTEMSDLISASDSIETFMKFSSGYKWAKDPTALGIMITCHLSTYDSLRSKQAGYHALCKLFKNYRIPLIPNDSLKDQFDKPIEDERKALKGIRDYIALAEEHVYG